MLISSTSTIQRWFFESGLFLSTWESTHSTQKSSIKCRFYVATSSHRYPNPSVSSALMFMSGISAKSSPLRPEQHLRWGPFRSAPDPAFPSHHPVSCNSLPSQRMLIRNQASLQTSSLCCSVLGQSFCGFARSRVRYFGISVLPVAISTVSRFRVQLQSRGEPQVRLTVKCAHCIRLLGPIGKIYLFIIFQRYTVENLQIGHPPDPDKPAAFRTWFVSEKGFGCMTARLSPQ
jgi:hypothetical protein